MIPFISSCETALVFITGLLLVFKTTYLLFLPGLLTASQSHTPLDEGQPYQNALHPRNSNSLSFLLLNIVVL